MLLVMRTTVGPIPSQVFPQTRRTFLLLLGEKAGMREVENHSASLDALTFCQCFMKKWTSFKVGEPAFVEAFVALADTLRVWCVKFTPNL